MYQKSLKDVNVYDKPHSLKAQVTVRIHSLNSVKQYCVDINNHVRFTTKDCDLINMNNSNGDMFFFFSFRQH